MDPNKMFTFILVAFCFSPVIDFYSFKRVYYKHAKRISVFNHKVLCIIISLNSMCKSSKKKFESNVSYILCHFVLPVLRTNNSFMYGVGFKNNLITYIMYFIFFNGVILR